MPDALDPIALLLRCTGAFYAFAGLVAGRAALSSGLLDAALARISGKLPSARERALTAWLTASAWLIFTGGILLMILAREAMWVFIAAALSQAFYLTIAAPYYFDVEDPPDAQGRRQTTNAFFIYFCATLVVIWASGQRLIPLFSLHPMLVWIAAGAIIAFAGYLIWHKITAARMAKGPPFASENLDQETSLDDFAEPPRSFAPRMPRVELSRERGSSPLKNQKTGMDIAPDTLPISQSLRSNLEDWFRDGDPELLGLAHNLAEQLAHECPDIAVAEPGIPNAYFNLKIESPYQDTLTSGPNWDCMTAIKIMSDYRCMPVWAANPGTEGHVPPNVLGISGGLEDALLDWQDRYDGFLNLDDPGKPRATDAELAAHEQDGIDLARRVKSERPDLTVYVHTTRGVLVVEPQSPPDQWAINNAAR